jgi:hypothetical protein
LVEFALLNLAAPVAAQALLHLADDGVRLLEREAELLEGAGEAPPAERVALAVLGHHLEPREGRRLVRERRRRLAPGLLGDQPPQPLHELVEFDHAVVVTVAVVLLELAREAHGVVGRDPGGLQRLDDRADREGEALEPVPDAQISPLHTLSSRRSDASTGFRAAPTRARRSSRSLTTFPVRPHTLRPLRS